MIEHHHEINKLKVNRMFELIDENKISLPKQHE